MSLTFADRCPSCGAAWDVRPELIGKTAHNFDGCAFRCEPCGIGFSNATNPAARRRITREAAANVPPEARVGLDAALDGAINIGNRTMKRQKICSAKSEDAVTWTVVAGLREPDGLRALLGDTKQLDAEALLLWGHPVTGGRAQQLRHSLVTVSDELGEHPDHRTEPDVMVLWPEVLLMVEAKYGSGNDRKNASYSGWKKYLHDTELFAASPEAVRADGAYQLVRNWVIGARIAATLGVAFRLCNLGPAGVAASAAAFKLLLHEGPEREFASRSWSQVLGGSSVADWLSEYGQRLKLI